MSVPTLLTLVGLMVTIMLAIAGGVAAIYQSVFIPEARSELQLKLDNLTTQYQEQRKLHDVTRDQLAGSEDARAKLVEAAASPILLKPKNDEVVIASEVTFQWDYKSEQIPHFIIEITRFSQNKLKSATYSVLQPQNRLFHIPITGEGDVGQYLWRIRPGLISEDKVVATGPWSAYQSFWVFTSVKQKIANMRQIRIGMYPSFTDKFNLPVAGGKYRGLSVELGRFIASELSDRLPPIGGDSPKEIQVEIVSYAFQDLLSELSKYSVDMVISSVTATKKREQQFDVIFSKGYHVTHQMLLSNGLTYDQKQALCENLRDKRIGVLKDSTNEQAANYVQKKCDRGIKIVDYLELIESKNALFRQEVDVLLTDDIWLTGQSNLATFRQFGPDLDEMLSEFYVNEYGRRQEEYAIAVPKKGGDDIVEIINDILNSDKAKTAMAGFEVEARGQIHQSSNEK